MPTHQVSIVWRAITSLADLARGSSTLQRGDIARQCRNPTPACPHPHPHLRPSSTGLARVHPRTRFPLYLVPPIIYPHSDFFRLIIHLPNVLFFHFARGSSRIYFSIGALGRSLGNHTPHSRRETTFSRETTFLAISYRLFFFSSTRRSYYQVLFSFVQISLSLLSAKNLDEWEMAMG